MKYINIILVGMVIFSFSCKQKKSDEKILARVGNTYITEDYLNEKIMETGEFDYLKTKIGKKQFLDVLINERLVRIASENSSIRNSKEYKDNVSRIEKELKKRMEEYKEVMLTKMWLEKIRENEVKVSESDIEQFLKENPYTVAFEQVVCLDYETAQNIMTQLKKGVGMDKIAQNYKDSDSIVVNKLPALFKGEAMEEIEDVVFKMKIGEIGGIIKTKLGYHVIKKTSQNSIDSKKNEVRERVRRILEKKKFDGYLKKLEEKYRVEVVDENYK